MAEAAEHSGVDGRTGTAAAPIWLLAAPAALALAWMLLTRYSSGAADPGSLPGALVRLGLSGPAGLLVVTLLSGVVGWLGLRRAARYARDGQPLLAVAVCGCAAAAVAPAGGRHQLVWVLLALAGRTGRRAADRAVWPVAALLVTLLPADVLLPNVGLLAPLHDHLPLLAVLAVACAVPFLPRSSPHWHHPVPTAYDRPARPRRRAPALPVRRRALSRPNLLLELLLIRVGYSAYSRIRAAAPGNRFLAEGHGRRIHALEGRLGLAVEGSVNRWTARHPWPREFFDFYYTSFHFVVPLTVLGLLYWRRPADYRWARSALVLATLLALLGFWLYPLAPPRLMPGLGFVDTVHGPQDLAHPQYGALTALSNQYAAMPSLHFGWSLWCGLVVLVLARRRWQRVLGLVHPLVTVCAIVATANHWVLDAVGGAAVVAAGFALGRVLWGPRSTPASATAAIPAARRPPADRGSRPQRALT